jgi:hypothetical protein
MTILTAEGNWIWQLDDCYIIVDGVFIVLIMDDTVYCQVRLCTLLNYINPISSQYYLINTSTKTNVCFKIEPCFLFYGQSSAVLQVTQRLRKY